MKNILSVTTDQVMSVYSGKHGCACGCRGKHSYNSKHVALPSFLKISAFRPPRQNELYLSVFGFVLVQENRPEDNKPRFVLELNPNEKGKVVCPHCHYDATMDSWAPWTDHVGCPQCGRSVTKLVQKTK
jgi:hypothetical protein